MRRFLLVGLLCVSLASPAQATVGRTLGGVWSYLLLPVREVGTFLETMMTASVNVVLGIGKALNPENVIP